MSVSDSNAATRRCPTCGSNGIPRYDEKIDLALLNDFTYASRKRPELLHYALRECEACDLLFAAQTPDVATLHEDYRSAQFDAAVESRFAAETYVRTLISLLGELPAGILDVGCGDGEFLRSLDVRGVADARGIEPSLAAAHVADASIADRIFIGGYQEFAEERLLRLITLFQTIEHLTDPQAFLQWARHRLEPGGYVAIACHNRRGAINRILGERSPIFDIEHLQLYSPESVSRALMAAGFQDIRVVPYRNTYPISYWVRLAPLPTWCKDRIEQSPLLRRLSVTLGVGNLMAIARRPA